MGNCRGGWSENPTEKPQLGAMEERVILGLDPGTRITGFGVLRQVGKTLSCMDHGVIRLAKLGEDHALRLAELFARVTDLAEEFGVTEVAVEAPFQGRNAQSALKLGRAQGVIMAAALAKGLLLAEYAPTKVKKAVTGRGAAEKEQVEALLHRWVPGAGGFATPDAADALAVAVCHALQKELPIGNPSSSRGWAGFVAQNPGRVR